MPIKPNTDYVLKKLTWMRVHHIWPNGLRYLWTDAFGVVLLVLLSEELGEIADMRALLDRQKVPPCRMWERDEIVLRGSNAWNERAA